ncbi:MAG TPA: hypothetical protein VLB84_18735 [Bacteroidia bacterium]|nr:hypothetical protein [Bacteroidia bacterium]
MNKFQIICMLLFLFCINKIVTAQFIGSNPIQQASAGNVAIGFPAYSPTSLLQVRNGSVLYEGTIGITPVSGAGTRMMWIPSKGAFRAGAVTANRWDDVNVGAYSFAVNMDNLVNGQFSFACGYNNNVQGWSGFASGMNNILYGIGAFVSGSSNTVGTTDASTAGSAAAFGSGNNVTGLSAAVFGINNYAQSSNSFVIGQYNLNPGNYSHNSWIATDPLFVIGNGTSTTARANAVTVLKNGNVGINTVNPNDKLSINGTLRMNNNPIFLSYDLNHGISYSDVYTNTGNYAGVHIDGPVLFGWSGGALGSKNAGSNNIALSWNSAGNVGIGAPNTGPYKLTVEGVLGARALKITLASWADFVFNNDYELKSLSEVEDFIKENKHLPEMPTSAEIEKEGLDVGEIQAKQMQKIEELTLYVIELNKKVEKLEKENKILKNN